MNKSVKRNIQFIIFGVILIVICFLVPRILLGEDSYIRIHDNLDDPIGKGVKLILGEGSGFFGGGALNIYLFLVYLFNYFIAYTINDLFVHIIAFIGMFLFIQKHVLDEEKDIWIIFGTSICFAFLPFYSNFGISVAGIPLLFYAFANLRNKNLSLYDYLIIIFFPFYSRLSLTGVFILTILCLIFIVDILLKRGINMFFFTGICLLILIYSISEINLIYNTFLSESFISHRSAWNTFSPFFVKPFSVSILYIIKNFVLGHYHAASLHIPILILSLILLLVFKTGRTQKSIVLFLAVIFLFSVLYSMYYWYLYAILKNKISLLNMFNIGRFHWFHPFLWYLLFAVCLSKIKNFKYSKVLIPAILVIQILYITISPLGANQELKYNIVRLFKKVEFTSKKMSYKEFFSEDLFHEIEDHIGKDKIKYRIGCIGFHPSIAQYNGFYTIDIYSNNYPLEYKKRFRRIISKELDKNPINKSYFDDWGNRCYFFIHDLKRNSVNNIKTSKLQESELDLDMKEFKQMGGSYLFSTVKIINYNQINLKYLKTFEKTSLPWRIHLYQVNL